MISKTRFTILTSISFVFIVWFCIVFSRSISPVVEGVFTINNARRMNGGPLAIAFLIMPFIYIKAKRFYENPNHNFPARVHTLMKWVAFFAGFFSFGLLYLTSNYDLVYIVYISVNMLISALVAGYLIRFLYVRTIRNNFKDIDIEYIHVDLKEKIAFSILIALNMTLIFINAYHILYKNLIYENEVQKYTYAIEYSYKDTSGNYAKMKSQLPEQVKDFAVLSKSGSKIWGDTDFEKDYISNFRNYVKNDRGLDYFLGRKNIFLAKKIGSNYFISQIPLGVPFQRIYKSIYLPVIVLVILGTISISLFTLILRKFVNAPLELLVTLITDLAEGEGDLTKKLNINSNDELGDISNKLNLFIGKVKAIVTDIAENSHTLTSSSSDMSKLSSQVSKQSDEISSQSNNVANAASEMTIDMTSAAAAMEQASANLSMVAAASEQMTNTINEIASNTESARSISGNAVEQASSVKKRVDELNYAANNIGNVTETITEISEQTNLLALNATIEAARAGEAGKGFNVVATEIKELAHQTANATMEIKSNVDGIQTATQSTISEIGEITEIIVKINEIISTIASSVEEQSASSKEITLNVIQASTGIQDVNKGVARSSSYSSNITNDIAEVNTSVSYIADSASVVNKNSEDLLSLSNKLNELVDKFKI